MFGAGWELRHMSISELMHRPERARRLEVFTGAGRRRTFPAAPKAAIVAESYAPGRTVCGEERRGGGGGGGTRARARAPPSPAVPAVEARPPRPAARPEGARSVCAARL